MGLGLVPYLTLHTKAKRKYILENGCTMLLRWNRHGMQTETKKKNIYIYIQENDEEN